MINSDSSVIIARTPTSKKKKKEKKKMDVAQMTSFVVRNDKSISSFSQISIA